MQFFIYPAINVTSQESILTPNQKLNCLESVQSLLINQRAFSIFLRSEQQY